MKLKHLLQNELEDGNDLAGTGSETADDSGSELASETGENQPKNEDGNNIDQDKVQKAINKQHAKFREEERKRIEAEKRAEEAEKLAAELREKNSVIEIPPMPDAYDEDYDAKVKVRDEAIRRKAEQDALKTSAENDAEAKKKAAENASAEAFNEKVTAYQNKAVGLGVKPEEMASAGELVGSYIQDMNVVEFIVEHEEGPLITKYLAANPVLLDELSSMNPMQAALKISNEIAPAASLLKPQASNAPDPAETLTGLGAGEQVDPLIKGATFE